MEKDGLSTLSATHTPAQTEPPASSGQVPGPVEEPDFSAQCTPTTAKRNEADGRAGLVVELAVENTIHFTERYWVPRRDYLGFGKTGSQ